jgi:energy-coupling factor transport system ATP-binding protein
LTIERGEFVGLIGQNGAGKTTLLKHLVGLLRPTAGQVLVHGVDIRDVVVADLATQIGFVLQNPDQQLFAQTVEEEIAFGPRNLKLPEEELTHRVNQAIARVGLDPFRGEFPPALNKGDRAKVVIASVLAMQPQIIILDEPTTGQDYRGCKQIMQIARQLHQQGRTVLVASHDVALIAEYCQRVVVLFQGEVLVDDRPENVFAQTDVLGRTDVLPPQITQLSQALSPSLDLPRHALTVEALGSAVVNRLQKKDEKGGCST